MSKKPDFASIRLRLAAVKQNISQMGDAMPTMAKELRRDSREILDDIILELPQR